jgi:anti-sigma B factor antagonist
MGTLNVENSGSVTIVRFKGSLTSADVREVEEPFNKIALVPGSRLVIDLSSIEMLNTPALTLFVGAVMFQRSRGGRVVFTGIEDVIQRLLKVCKLDTVLCVVKDRNAAIAEAGR